MSKLKGATIEPYLWLRRVMPLKDGIPHGGTFIHWGTRLSKPLDSAVTANLDLQPVHDSGAFGYKPGLIGRAIGNLTWRQGRWGKHVSVQLPLVTFSAPLTHTGDGRKRQISYGIGFAFQ